MEESKSDGTELRSLIRGVIDEFVQAEQVKAEPAYKAELLDERKRREDLEKRVNELIQENAAAGKWRKRLIEARRFGRSYNGWAWRKWIWRIAP